MIEGKTTNLMRALKDGPVETVEKAMTAEAVWPGAEFPTAEAKTAAGTEAASNAEIFSESNDVGVEFDPKMNPSTGNEKLRVIKDGVNRNKP